jgi:hypothetical protein
MARLVGAVPEKDQLSHPYSVNYQIDCEKLQQSSTTVIITMETDDGVQIQLEPSDYILRV